MQAAGNGIVYHWSRVMDWPKLIYELIGPKYPVLSLIGVSTLGAILFGGAWWILGRHYEKEHPNAKQASFDRLPAKLTILPSLTSTEIQTSSADDIHLQILEHHSNSIYGFIVSITNGRLNTIGGCTVRIRDARSFDSHHAAFRDSYQFVPRPISMHVVAPDGTNKTEIAAGETTQADWLLKINQDHLELGNDARWPLYWPKVEASSIQVWLLSLSVETTGLNTWDLDIRIEWSPPDMLRLGLV